MGTGASSAAADTRRIVVTSVGVAGPMAAAAVAKGLGVPAEWAVAAVYRAPAVLADRVPLHTAEAMVRLLTAMGLHAMAVPQDEPAPTAPTLYDVALYLSDPRAVPVAAAELAAFAAIDESAVLAMILTPPGLVLGAVSTATVEALSVRLPRGVELVAARPADSTYHLFLADGPAAPRTRFLADLEALGLPAIAQSGLVATAVPHALVQQLWRRHQAAGLMRAVNAAFLRYDVVLTALGGVDPADPEVGVALQRHTAMPAEVAPSALKDLPLTLMEGVAQADLADRLAVLTALGLEVRAELTTFQHLTVVVSQPVEAATLRPLLARFDLCLNGAAASGAPFEVVHVPELQARILRTALEDAGATVHFAGGSA